jgi:hypothetical protein
LRKPDPKSKGPKDESLVGETKDEDKEKEEVSKKNKEVSEIGSNNNKNSMSKVNICKADDSDTSTVTVTSTSLETTKHQNSLEHKTPLLVINNSTTQQQPSTPDNNNASLNNYCSADKKNEKISSIEKSEKSGAGESLELRSSLQTAADDSFNKTDLQEKIHEIPGSANDESILDRATRTTIQTGAVADKKNLDTISSFTPVISSDADHDNQKLIKEEKSIEKTATLDKTTGGSSAAAEVLVQSSQKLGKSATNLNDEDIIDSSALPVKISSSQLEKEVNTSATAADKLELDTLAVNEQKDNRSKDAQPTDSIVDRYLKDTDGKFPETEIETNTAAVKSDRSDKIQAKNVSADNKPVKTENQLHVSAEIPAVNEPVKTETQTENQSVTAEVPTVNKPVKTETQAENQSVTAEVPAVRKPVKSSSFVFISKPVKTETEAENQSGSAENQSGAAEKQSCTAENLVKEAEGWVPWEPEPIPEIESVQTLVQKGLEVLIETTELNISSEDEVDSDDDFGDADPVQVIRSCIAACHLLHTTFSRKIFQLCLCFLLIMHTETELAKTS